MILDDKFQQFGGSWNRKRYWSRSRKRSGESKRWRSQQWWFIRWPVTCGKRPRWSRWSRWRARLLQPRGGQILGHVLRSTHEVACWEKTLSRISRTRMERRKYCFLACMRAAKARKRSGEDWRKGASHIRELHIDTLAKRSK